MMYRVTYSTGGYLSLLAAMSLAAAGAQPLDGQAAKASNTEASSTPSSPHLTAAGPRHATMGADSVEAPLRVLMVVPMTGGSSRFDYQSFDPERQRLYIAHMGAGQLVAFDVRARHIVATVDGFPKVTGVLVVPSLNRIYASAAGAHRVMVVDGSTLKVIAEVGGISFPDGLAYAPDRGKLFVSDEVGRRDLVIDVHTNRAIGAVELGGEAGNTQYDSVARRIWVAVQTLNSLVAIDPATDHIVGRYVLPGADHPHGLLIDAPRRLAFVANQGNHRLHVVDLRSMRVLSDYQVGEDPDVLAFDPGLRRLYVAAESGEVTVFTERADGLEPAGRYRAPHAHSVAVDPGAHEVFLPLADVKGRPVLRILAPTSV